MLFSPQDENKRDKEMAKIYLWQNTRFPQFEWDTDVLIAPLGEVHTLQGQLLGRMAALGFEGKLTTQKYAKINHCSQDTALRDIQALIEKHILRKTDEGGRSTNYELLT